MNRARGLIPAQGVWRGVIFFRSTAIYRRARRAFGGGAFIAVREAEKRRSPWWKRYKRTQKDHRRQRASATRSA